MIRENKLNRSDSLAMKSSILCLHAKSVKDRKMNQRKIVYDSTFDSFLWYGN